MPPRKRAGDLTGLETERLQKEHQAELKQRAQEISMMAEVEAEQNDIPIDYSHGPLTHNPELDVEDEVELKPANQVIIPNTNLESVTFGAGQHFSFEEGRKYTVSRELAEHLRSKGLLWNERYR